MLLDLGRKETACIMLFLRKVASAWLQYIHHTLQCCRIFKFSVCEANKQCELSILAELWWLHRKYGKFTND